MVGSLARHIEVVGEHDEEVIILEGQYIDSSVELMWPYEEGAPWQDIL